MTLDARNRSGTQANPIAKRGERRQGQGLLLLLAVASAAYAIHAVIDFTTARPSTPASAVENPRTGPATTGERPNIAQEVASDDYKFMRLTEMGKTEVESILRDPDSAKYEEVGAYSPPIAKGSVNFCGLVNSRNGFGGYSGYERFISVPNVGAWLQSSPGIRFHQVWRDFCRQDALVKNAYF